MNEQPPPPPLKANEEENAIPRNKARNRKAKETNSGSTTPLLNANGHQCVK